MVKEAVCEYHVSTLAYGKNSGPQTKVLNRP
jgi:hypothetical protein